MFDRYDLSLLDGHPDRLPRPSAHGLGADARAACGPAHGDADRAAGHREDLPPSGACQVQLHALLAHALPHRVPAPLSQPHGRQEAYEALRRPSALPRHRRGETRRRSREIPARSQSALCHRLRADRDRAAVGRSRSLDGASRLDGPPGSGRAAAFGEYQPRDPAGRDRGPHAERHGGVFQKSRGHERGFHGRRLVPHGRPRGVRQGRMALHQRPSEEYDRGSRG